MLGDPTIVPAPGIVVEVAPPELIGDVVVRRLVTRAVDDLDGLASGSFAQPTGGVRWSKAAFDPHIEFVAFAFTQFALPVTAGADLDFDFRPAPGLRSPPAVSPLLARTGDGVTLLAPVDGFHEQIIAVVDDGLRWGWHGDLDRVAAGFSTSSAIYEGESVDAVLDAWRVDLALDLALDIRPERPSGMNPLSTHLSYWTDNGAAYWYRTEAGRTIAESVVDVVERLSGDGVPVCAIELDSWFYPHTTLRPITEIGYPEEVPPTGMSTWDARPDAYPPTDGDPLFELSERLGRPPLVLHARHVAPTSPYVTEPGDWWIDDLAAHPVDPMFFRRWFDDAVRWGATVLEQDWMLMYWFGVRALRAQPGRAADWQRALDAHAGATGVDLLWCMATPADLMLAASLDRVIAVRTCDDYRFADDPAFLWTWFLTVNRLANTLGLAAFKDCFFSNPDVSTADDAIDGDPHAELEALLSALSGGPVGIGDRIGRTNREIVMRTCDDDGRLRRVDGAIAAIDDALFGAPGRGERLMWATTTATTATGRWTYLVAINTAADRSTVLDRRSLGREATVYDWRQRSTSVVDEVVVELSPREWALFVVSPPGRPGAADVGDPTKYVVVEAASSGV